LQKIVADAFYSPSRYAIGFDRLVSFFSVGLLSFIRRVFLFTGYFCSQDIFVAGYFRWQNSRAPHL
jgi:hypothetical protein